MSNKTFICTQDDNEVVFFTVNKEYTVLESGGVKCDDGFEYHAAGYDTAIGWLEANTKLRFKKYKPNIKSSGIKVRCIRCEDVEDYFTLGKVYEIIKFGITDDSGYFWSGDKLNSLDDLNTKFSDNCFQGGYEFELVEEN